jgi:hypothetical protein
MGSGPGASVTGETVRAASPVGLYKSKKASKKSSHDKVEIDPLPNVQRGQTSVPVRVMVSQPDLICKLVIKYYSTGDKDSTDDVVADGNSTCVIFFDASKSRDAIGDASATVKVVDKSNNPHGEARVNFDLR